MAVNKAEVRAVPREVALKYAGVNLLSFAACIVANATRGREIGKVGDDLAPDLRIMPATWAFSIWGLIYSLLVGFCFWAFWPSNTSRSLLEALGFKFVAVNLFNIAWVFLWTMDSTLGAFLSSLAIFGLLGSLLSIYDGVCWAKHDTSLGHTEPIFNPTVPRLFLFDVAFSVYSGWVTLATILNVSILITALGFDGGNGADEWTAVMLCIAAVINIVVGLKKDDPCFPSVYIWGSLAISNRQQEMGHGLNVINYTAFATIAAVALIVLRALWKRGSVEYERCVSPSEDGLEEERKRLQKI